MSDGISFHSLSDFSLVIVKPDRRIVYTGCQWSEIAETGQLSEMVAEKITMLAKGRVDFIFPADYSRGTALDETVKNILRRMAITDRLTEENAQQLRAIGRSEIPEQACLF